MTVERVRMDDSATPAPPEDVSDRLRALHEVSCMAWSLANGGASVPGMDRSRVRVLRDE